MSTITPSITAGQELLAHTQQATATITRGSAKDVSTAYAVRVFVALGRSVATALTNEVLFRLEGSAKTSGNDEWYPLYSWKSAYGTTACTATTVNDATMNASDTTFTATSGTGLSGGQTLYARETGTPANSEWINVDSVSGTTVTCEALTRNHTNGIALTTLAEKWAFDVDVADVARIRLVVDTNSNASGQTVDVLGWYSSLDNNTIA